MSPNAERCRAVILLAALALAPSLGAQQSPASQALTAIVQEVLLRRGAAGGDASLSLEVAERQAEASRALLARLNAIDAAGLSHQEDLTRDVLRVNAQAVVDQAALFWFYSAVMPATSPLTGLLTGAPEQRVATENDRRQYLSNLDRVIQTLEAVHAKERGRATRGIILPDEQVDRVLSFLDPFSATSPASPFSVAADRLKGVAPADMSAFQAGVAERIDTKIAPAARALVATMQELAPKAPRATGWSIYPGGQEAYRIAVKGQTTLEVTPEQVHQIGLDAVADIERQMADVRKQMGFAGTKAEFHDTLRRDPRFYVQTPDQFGAALMTHIRRIEPKVRDFFSISPEAIYGVTRLHPAREPSQTYGYYSLPSATEPRGLYFFNGSTLSERSLLVGAALIFHELVPGHHFQINLQTESKELPPVRKSMMFAGYTEGWGEYSSSVVAREMGMYSDPYDLYGRLVFDNFFAVRLVVDTGMNYYGWSRPKAMLYMREHTLESDVQIDSETIRYSMRSPAQALAYRMGRQTIVRLREKATKALGARFDIRRFHNAVLSVGSIPLTTLERHIDHWIGVESAR